jgi:tetratricopeptide (TPR) repeat protein
VRPLERDDQLGALASHWARARSGKGGVALVSGEAGAGKTTLVDAFVRRDLDGPVLWGACEQLSTPRPLGPVRDLTAQLGDVTRDDSGNERQPHEIYAAVFEHLRDHPSVLVVDDLHWADQATIDLVRFLLRRIASTRSMVIGTLRDDELGIGHPLRALLGDVARSPDAISTAADPLSIDAVVALVGERSLDARWLHGVTAGNAFFVVEMLDHTDGDLPSNVRDAILARTSELDPMAWDLLHLLACAPEAIADPLLAPLGIGVPSLQAVDDAGLTRRGVRGVTFRHALCRAAIAGTIPPGGDVALHRRMLDALATTPHADPAVLVHHALGAHDPAAILEHAVRAGRAAARAGAHTQAADLFAIALDQGALTAPDTQAELLELLADECYLIDRLDEAIAASESALRLRERDRDAVGVSVNHRLLSLYHWYDADRANAERHADEAVAALAGVDDDATSAGPRGHAIAMQAYLAFQANDLDRARALSTAAALAAGEHDPTVPLRAAIIEGICDVLDAGRPGRDATLSILGVPEDDLDEIYSGGYSNLTYLDVEQRRLDDAA